jgi:hypothetical protein
MTGENDLSAEGPHYVLDSNVPDDARFFIAE